MKFKKKDKGNRRFLVRRVKIDYFKPVRMELNQDVYNFLALCFRFMKPGLQKISQNHGESTNKSTEITRISYLRTILQFWFDSHE